MNWGFSPVIVYWLYTAILKPILLYGNIALWPSLENIVTLSNHKIQRRRALHQGGALHHRHWSIEYYTRRSTPGPTCQKLGIKNHSKAPRSSNLDNRHNGSLQYTNKSEIHSTHNRLRSTHSQLWKKSTRSSYLPVQTGTTSHTNSKMPSLYTQTAPELLSFRLPDHCRVFQAEVMAFQIAISCLDTSDHLWPFISS